VAGIYWVKLPGNLLAREERGQYLTHGGRLGVIELHRWHTIEHDRGTFVNAARSKLVKHGMLGVRFARRLANGRFG
jgi:hypothetical protein